MSELVYPVKLYHPLCRNGRMVNSQEEHESLGPGWTVTLRRTQFEPRVEEDSPAPVVQKSKPAPVAEKPVIEEKKHAEKVEEKPVRLKKFLKGPGKS